MPSIRRRSLILRAGGHRSGCLQHKTPTPGVKGRGVWMRFAPPARESSADRAGDPTESSAPFYHARRVRANTVAGLLMADPIRLVALVSGGGTTLQNLIDRVAA